MSYKDDDKYSSPKAMAKDIRDDKKKLAAMKAKKKGKRPSARTVLTRY